MTSLIGQRFRLDRPLKLDDGNETYCGWDLLDDRPVVVKLASHLSANSAVLRRLSREAAVLRELDEPGMAPLVAFGKDEQRTFLVTPYVPGVTLREFLRYHGTLSPLDAACLGVSLCRILASVHERGVLHRDIKPENIIVNSAPPLNAVTLVDFGLAINDFRAKLPSEALVGTAAYLSPEQSGLIHRPVDARSDLYSLGAVLYEAAVGRPPFAGNTLAEALQQQLNTTPQPAAQARPEIPETLSAVIRLLLSKDPEERYQRADAVLADLATIYEDLRAERPETQFLPGMRDTRRRLGRPQFVGRACELEALLGAVEKAAAGAGGIVRLEAESGGGKTWLLHELQTRISGRNALVLTGQGLDQAAQRPFQLLSGVIEHFVATDGQSPELQRQLQPYVSSLHAVFPELEAVFGSQPSESLGPEQFGERRTLDALAMFLTHLGRRERPAVVLLDDCQWSDALSLRLLKECADILSGGQRPISLLIVLSFRSEEAPFEHPLRLLKTGADIKLERFSPEEVALQTQSMAGLLPAESIELVASLADGSPFMATAVLHGLVESGALYFEDEQWKHDPEASRILQSSSTAATFLVRRFHLLPRDILAILKNGAVLGKTFEMAVLQRLAGADAEHLKAALTEARERHIIWHGPEGGSVSFVHDKLREALISMLDPETFSRLHRKAAEVFREDLPGSHFEIAYHYDAAGEPERALPHALKAAGEARARYSLALAEEQLRIAERGCPQSDAETKRHIAESLGDVLLLQGKYQEAGEKLGDAALTASKPYERAAILLKLGDLHFKKGQMNEARENLNSALELLGYVPPGSYFGYMAAVAWEAAVQTLHTLMPRIFLHRRSSRGQEHEMLAIRILSRLAYVHWFESGFVPCLWAHLREVNRAERYEATPELAQAYSEHAPVMTMIPWIGRAMKYVERSLEIRRRFHDVWGEAQSYHFKGVAYYAASKFRESLECCRIAAKTFERTGDRWELNTANWHIAICQLRIGRLAEAVESAQRVYDEAIRIGDLASAGISLAVWSKASGGHVPDVLVSALAARITHDIQTKAELMQAEGLISLRQRQYEEAVDCLEKAWRLVKHHGLRQEYVAPILPWLATAYRLLIESHDCYQPRQRAVHMRRAFKWARRARRLARSYRNNLPHALRELGLLYALAGRRGEAISALENSLDAAEGQGAIYEQWLTQMALEKLGLPLPAVRVDGEQFGEPGARIAFMVGLAQRPESYVETGGGDTLTLVNRFEAIVGVGRDICAASDRESLFTEVLKGVETLLFASRCAIVRVDEETDPAGNAETVAGGRNFAISRQIVAEVVASGQPMTFTSQGSAYESLELQDVRSGLCAPIFCDGEARFLIYLTHDEVFRLFGPDDLRLAGFISTIAGSALETIESIETLQAQTEELISSNAELQRFAYIASHDLQEPLRTLVCYSQLLEQQRDAALSEEARQSLEVIVRSSKRMFNLVNDLMSYSRLSSLESLFEAVPAETLVNAAVEQLREAIRASAAEIKWSQLPEIYGASTLLVQLFQNLIGNAIKFRGDKPPVVAVRAADRGDYWQFEVADNGIGFDPKYSERIFEIFRRLHPHHRISGSGLGLAIARKVVQRHGGRIWAESQPGRGATFYFTLAKRQGRNGGEEADGESEDFIYRAESSAKTGGGLETAASRLS